MDSGREMRSGGAILLLGALLFIVSIGFELSLGWPPSGEDTDAAALMLQAWDSLRWIWTIEALATFLFALSALTLARSRHLEDSWRPSSIIWSAVAIGAILATVGFALALGSYPPALQTLEQNPELFEAVRGGIRATYEMGMLVQGLGHLALFLREGIANDGVVPRAWLLGFAGSIVAAIGIVVTGLLRPAAAGVVTFLVPALLGLALWRAGRQLPVMLPD